MSNCLGFALRVWKNNNSYKLWYNSDHVINIPESVKVVFEGAKSYRPAEEFGYVYFKEAFTLNEKEKQLLKQYFHVEDID